MVRLGAAIAACAMLAGSAQAGCWTREEANAAGVRQLQSMLMVTALRCQAAGRAMIGDYNGFVAANRQPIAAMNERIRAHFIHAQGGIAGERAYDSFTTSMANGYGAGEGVPASCAAAAALAREAGAMAGSTEGLLMLAARLELAPSLPEGRCAPAAPAMMVASAGDVRQPPYASAPAFGQAASYASAPEDRAAMAYAVAAGEGPAAGAMPPARLDPR